MRFASHRDGQGGARSQQVAPSCRAQCVNTRIATFRHLNTQIVCQNFRQRSAHSIRGFVQKHQLKPTVDHRQPRVQQQPVEKKRRGGGGSWRFHIHKKSSGVKTDFRALCESYRNRDNTGLAEVELQAGAKIGTIAIAGVATPSAHLTEKWRCS